ncbi:MAG: lysostaphin resistance A-like protein [Paracoccaceae bacterium]
MVTRPGTPFDAFIAPARARPQMWRLILGSVLAIGVYLGLFAAAAALVVLHYGVFAAGILTALVKGIGPGGVLMLLCSFAGLAAGAVISARLLHGRRAGTLFGAALRPVAADLLRAVGAAGAVGGGAALLWVLPAGDAAANPGRAALWLFYPFAALALLVQVTAEEMVFRGYLMQQLAARFAPRAVWMGIPAALFALAHYAPETYGAAAWAVVAWAGLFGILAADLTVRTGNLGAAIGFHFANNALSLFVVGARGNMDALALWSVPFESGSLSGALPMLAADALAIVIAWLAVRLALRV